MTAHDSAFPSHPWLSRIGIRHFAGVEADEAFEIDSFSPGINLVHGPNGSGKTTTARALQELLWNQADSPEYRLMDALLKIGNRSWNLAWNATRPEVHSQDGSTPPRQPPELRSRYTWSLRDLLHATDQDLAVQIAREMAGGVDFEALERLSRGGVAPSFPRKLHDQFEKASAKAREILQTQARLQHRSEQLEDLQTERSRLEVQHARGPLLVKLIELRDREAERDRLRQQLREFPESLAQGRREDETRIEDLENALNASVAEVTDTSRQLQELGSGEEMWALFPSERIREARKALELALTDLDHCREEEVSRLQVLESEEIAEQELRKRLCLRDDQAESLLRNVMIPELREWIQLVMRQNRISEELEALDLRLRDLPEVETDAEVLRDAERDLRTWLASVERPGIPALSGFGVTYLLWIVLVFLAAGSLSPGWYGLIPVPLLIQMVCLRFFGNQTRRAIETRYPDGVKRPDTWEESQVRETLSEVESSLGEIQRIASFEPDRLRRQHLEEQSEGVNTSISILMKTLWDEAGLPELTPEWAGLFLLDVKDWREARIQIAQAEQRLEEARSRRADQEEVVMSIFREWASGPPGESLTEYGRELLDRLETEQDYREQVKLLRTREAFQKERLEELRKEESQLFSRLNIEPGDWSGARALLSRLDEYLTISEKLTLRTRQVEEERMACQEAGEMLEYSREQLLEERQRCEQAGLDARSLEKEIQEILAEIRQATRGRQMHEIRELQEDLRGRLEQERAAILRARLVQTVVDWLREECRTGRRPEVLDTANAHLGRMTQGALQLTLSLDKGVEEFRAAAPGVPARPLEHLSAGERTQVLMAVRLAFLQHQEDTPFPLFVDEVLGTSDDTRTRAILQTLIEVARQGRQVFAFTAQTEEVGKWMQVLEQSAAGDLPVPFQVIDLGALRKQTSFQPIRLPTPPSVDPEHVHRKAGETDEEWAIRLHMPQWTPHRSVNALPLIYLLRNEEAVLIRCLQAGVTTWGALRVLIEGHASDRLVEPALAKVLERKAKALEALVDAWRIGRPPPLSPQVLVDSGMISATRLPPVLEILQDHGGSIPPFLESLDSGAVPQWGKKKTERLREYLIEEGYFVMAPCLSLDEIRARAMAKVNQEVSTDSLTPSDWGDLISFLTPHV